MRPALPAAYVDGNRLLVHLEAPEPLPGREHVDADDFPDLDALYRELGLQPVSATRVRLDPTAGGAAIGTAIMSPMEG